MTVFRLLPGLALAGLLAACSNLTALTALTDATEPTDLYVLSPKSTFDADLPQVRRQLVVEEPTAAAAVNTDRIAVKPNAFQVQYFPDARWTDRAPLLVQNKLVESFENSGKMNSVSEIAIALASDFVMLTDLREFQAETTEEEGAPLTVNVRLNVKLVEGRDGFIIASESFANRATAASEDMIDIVAAFDDALGSVMRDAVEFTIRQISDFGPDEQRGFGAEG